MRVYMPADSAADDKPKQFLGLSGTQTIGSALAAVTSALVGSFTGAAGTLIGAALGSVVATVGAALYARTLSSAATVAMKKIPQRGRGGLTAGDAEVLSASAPAESDAPGPNVCGGSSPARPGSSSGRSALPHSSSQWSGSLRSNSAPTSPSPALSPRRRASTTVRPGPPQRWASIWRQTDGPGQDGQT